jgi:hypothetical protein
MGERRSGLLRGHPRIEETAEDHLSRSGLQHARHHDVDGLADHLARVIHDDHGAVVEVGDALVVLLAFLQDEYLHQLARQDHRLERVGELVDVQHLDAAELRHLVQVEIVGDDLSLQRPRQLDQLQIDLAHVGEIDIGDHHVDARHLLDLLEDVESAPAAVALERITRIGYELQLLEYELRDDQRAVHEAGLADVGDAAVDDDAGIEDPVSALRAAGPEEADEARGVEPFAATAANHHAEVRQCEQDEAVEEDDAAAAKVRPVEGRPDRLRERKPDGAAKQCAEHVRDRRVLQPDLDADDQDAEDGTKQEVLKVPVEGLELMCRPGNGRDEQNAGENEPRHEAPPGWVTCD